MNSPSGVNFFSSRRSRRPKIRSYSDSGVSISEGERFAKYLRPLARTTFSKNVLSGIGNFGAFFQIPGGYKKPVLVASTDGVGTKLKIAASLRRFDTIGEDLVNHCVNDIAVCGARPLFFLDYLAFGKLKAATALGIARGFVRGCKRNECSLIGGETAEMPGLYSEDDFDVAGTIVGIAEKAKLLNKKNVRAGDVIIGVESNGLHTNGYSLVRKVLLTKLGLNEYIKELHSTLGEELLRIHRSYLKLIQLLLKKFRIGSFAHITGGGIAGNTNRVVPEHLKANLEFSSWKVPPIFMLIQEAGGLSNREMRKVFNLGIGLTCIVRAADAKKIMRFLTNQKEKSYIIGEVIAK
jgi:phosphoribosylformylglycinamidine cyclo-ligase